MKVNTSSFLLITIFLCQFQILDGSGFIPPVGVVIDYSINNLKSNSFIACYDQSYNSITKSTAFARCNGSVVFVGAMISSSSNIIKVGAFGTKAIFNKTMSTGIAVENNGVYWYFVPQYAFGFSPSAPINLNRADVLSENCAQRLSWHIDSTFGGFRAGCNVSLFSDVWRKVVFTSQQPLKIATSSPSIVPTMSPVRTLTTSNPSFEPTRRPLNRIYAPTLLPTYLLNITDQTSGNKSLSRNSIVVGIALGVSFLSICLASAFVFTCFESRRRWTVNEFVAPDNFDDKDKDKDRAVVDKFVMPDEGEDDDSINLKF